MAVKRFINQTLDERRMLEFRAEMAFLSELHHPNIVLFIGAFRRSQSLLTIQVNWILLLVRCLLEETESVHPDRVRVGGQLG